MPLADLTAKARRSTVVISVLGRNGEQSSLGSGFVVSADGLIATNLHVIGEARPIQVAMSDGTKYSVTEIHATDQAMDLAVVRVKAQGLPALEIGNSDTLKAGQDVAAIGNPRGLEHSVVSGVVSAVRTIDKMPLIQLAMPIEQGNSGGPLLDRRGRVQGILTMKSVVTVNLGFAVAINALKPLLRKPNPVPIDRWLTIGALDSNEWTQLFGGHWRQRAGRMIVAGPGEGFGGRTALVSRRPAPDRPFEIAVWVRLKREDGAAGLAFYFQGPERHYGFYPTNGRIRLTRFDGPDVFSWQILKEVHSAAYRPGEWNRLKVRVDSEKIRGYVNDVLVVESTDAEYRAGSAGLASFRDTNAEFKGFEIGKNLPSVLPSPQVIRRVEQVATGLKLDQAPDAGSIEKLLPDGNAAVLALREQADRREKQAKQLRRLADAVQLRGVQRRLSSLLDHKSEKEIDLLRAALLVARIDNEDLDVDAYVREVDRMAAAAIAVLPKTADATARLAALDDYLFKTQGFHGSRLDFYNRSNSYLNEVIDDREGLPITLAVLYIELARRIGIDIVGLGLPGRFLVRLEGVKDNATLIDVFAGARRISRQAAEEQAALFSDRTLTADDWHIQSKREIVLRLVQNLVNVAQESNDSEAMLRYVDVLLMLEPDSLAEHWRRALLCFQTGQHAAALEECRWLLTKDREKLSVVVDVSQIEQLKNLLETQP